LTKFFSFQKKNPVWRIPNPKPDHHDPAQVMVVLELSPLISE
jgi:hypothetical protein